MKKMIVGVSVVIATIFCSTVLFAGWVPKAGAMKSGDNSKAFQSKTVFDVKIPKVKCSDSDGGIKSELFGAATSGSKVVSDVCKAGIGDSDGNIISKLRKMLGKPYLSPGLHSGSYGATLYESMCVLEKASSVLYDCALENKSCVDGVCRASKCEINSAEKKITYQGFALAASGVLVAAPEIKRDLELRCDSDTVLSGNTCSDVPQYKYIVLNKIEAGKTYVANQGEKYIERKTRACTGVNVPIPCFSDAKLSGCINKDKLAEKVGEYPLTDAAVERIKNGPDFAICAEDLGTNCPDENDPNRQPWDVRVDAEQDSGTQGSGPQETSVSTSCRPLEGGEAGGGCPGNNGVKIVTLDANGLPTNTIAHDGAGNLMVYCDACISTEPCPSGQHCMYQYMCAGPIKIRKLVTCGAKICLPETNVCDGCQNPSQALCGEQVQY